MLFVNLRVLTPCHKSYISATQMVAPHVAVHVTTYSIQGVYIWEKLTHTLVSFIDNKLLW